MGNYTTNLENQSWNTQPDWKEDDDVFKMVEFLNSSDSFSSFGEGIVRIINIKHPEVTIDSVGSYIKNRCTLNKIPIERIASPGTLNNWFSKGLRPKKGEVSRRSMFALAFALGLDVNETKELFHKVYLDRAFNYRNKEDLVYCYCIMHGRSWTDAESLLSSITDTDNSTDTTVYTELLSQSALANDSDSELIEYIESHSHNFEQNDVTAKKEFKRLLSLAKQTAKREMESPEYEEVIYGKWKKGDEISNNLLYQMILDTSVSGSSGTKTIFRNANLPKEIKNRFPEALTLGKEDMPTEERRKVIILLNSYCTWAAIQINSDEFGYDYDDYVEEMNNLLFKCNFSEMYYGNPYDWMFLTCAKSEYPLDSFRDIIQEVLFPDSTKVTE